MNSFAFSAARIQVFLDRKTRFLLLLPPSLLACEQNDGSLESQDMAENRKVSLAHQKGVFRGNYPLRRKGPEPEVLQRRT